MEEKKQNAREIVTRFNDNHNIKDVIEIITGINFKGKSCCCPLHGGDNPYGASVDVGKNVFTCWTHDCGRALSPWNFINKYYGLKSFKDTARKCNELFNANIPIYEKEDHKKHIETKELHNLFKVNNYLSECNDKIKKLLEEKDRILLNANTGMGKTYGITNLMRELPNDYTFFLVPNRAMVRQISKDYKYSSFLGNDTRLPIDNKYIVATYHKAKRIIEELNRNNENRISVGEMPLLYNVVCDEVHELMSKRNLYKNFIRDLEAFILNADKIISMSANTKEVEKAYENTGLFNDTITIESATKQFNIKDTFVCRISTKKKERNYIIVNKIIKMLETHSKILIYEDNIENLKTYKQLLENKNISSVILNSKNKGDESESKAQEEYDNIIQNNKLKNLVVFTTSVINAGVNIKNENICVIANCTKLVFDSTKVNQLFGRPRAEKGKESNNTAILFLDKQDHGKFLNSFDSKLKYYTNFVELNVSDLNDYYFNKYGLEIDENILKIDWDLYSKNYLYKKVKDCIYIENGIFKVDYIAIYELARIETERANYWNDKYINSLLYGLKTKNPPIFSVIESNQKLEVEKLEEPNKLNFEEKLKAVYDNENAIKELFLYYDGKLSNKDFKEQDTQEFYNTFKEHRKYKELKQNLKPIFQELAIIKDSVPKTYIYNEILEVYMKELNKKDRVAIIETIKREHIYNKQFLLGTSPQYIKNCGDIIYLIVREACDCFVKYRNKPNKAAYNQMINDYVLLHGGCYKEGSWYDKRDKKIKPQKIEALINECIKQIYNCSNELHLYDLK